MRFMVVPASASRPSLVVETVAAIDEAAIDRLRQWMYGLRRMPFR